MESTMKRCMAGMALVLMLAGCVNVDPKTGKTIPQGRQKNEFAKVEQLAERVENGMTKPDVLMLLGSPAKSRNDGMVWIYLPERSTFLIPSRSLQMVFDGNVLVKHGYRAIVFGHPF